MAINPINVGASANDGTGDPLRNAFIKVNANEADLDSRKAEASDVNSALQNKADITYVDDQVAPKADKTYVDDQLALKANAADIVPASTTVAGIVRLATTDETLAGTSNTIANTPAGIHEYLVAGGGGGLGYAPVYAQPPTENQGRPIINQNGVTWYWNGNAYAVRSATTTNYGYVTLATVDEAKAGTNTTKAVTPEGVKEAIANAPPSQNIPDASTTQKGIIRIATTSETEVGTSNDLAVSPAGLRLASNAGGWGEEATEQASGKIRIATQTETTEGQIDNAAITPLKLQNKLTNYTPQIPPASTTVQGIIQLATNEEVSSGVDTAKAVTPASLTYAANEKRWGADASTIEKGIVSFATDSETINGDEAAKAVTPAGLKAAETNGGWGNIATDTVVGKVRLATDEETITGDSGDIAVTPKGLAATAVDKRWGTPATTEVQGIIQIANEEESRAMQNGTKAITPLGLSQAFAGYVNRIYVDGATGDRIRWDGDLLSTKVDNQDGYYRITHNWGNTGYYIVVTPQVSSTANQETPFIPVIGEVGENHVDVRLFNISGNRADCSFFCYLQRTFNALQSSPEGEENQSE